MQSINIFINSFEKLSNKAAKDAYFNYMMPFICYAIINLIRIFLPRNLKILFLEIFINLIFIFLSGTNHIFFLSLTIISMRLVFLMRNKFSSDAVKGMTRVK